jgi:hypothetical protein
MMRMKYRSPAFVRAAHQLKVRQDAERLRCGIRRARRLRPRQQPGPRPQVQRLRPRDGLERVQEEQGVNWAVVTSVNELGELRCPIFLGLAPVEHRPRRYSSDASDEQWNRRTESKNVTRARQP